jgi:hypothetical protein
MDLFIYTVLFAKKKRKGKAFFKKIHPKLEKKSETNS